MSNTIACFLVQVKTFYFELQAVSDDLHSGGIVRWVPVERVRGGESFADSRINIWTGATLYNL